MFPMRPCAALLAMFFAVATAAASDTSQPVRLQRVPDGGIQPQAIAGPDGRVHLIYYKGEHRAGDVYYVQSQDGGKTFSKPIRVNSEPATAVAMGGVRGAHMAIGKQGRVHVAWMGARQGPHDPQAHDHAEAPMWYTRLDDSGEAFEPQRNMLSVSAGLDGGGSVAADAHGNVHVAWHGVPKSLEARDETRRQVWMRVSADEGKTFREEAAVTRRGEGVCACCGMRAFADASGNILIMHRSATNFINRDMMLSWGKPGGNLKSLKIDPWQVNRCPMSTTTMAASRRGAALAWETDGKVFVSELDVKAGRLAAPLEPPGESKGRKHPSVAVSAGGAIALAWTEGMAWNRGGNLAWQVFDTSGKPLAKASGRAPGVPAFSLVSIVALQNKSFVLFY